MNQLSKNIITEWSLEELSPQEQIDVVERLGRLIYQALLVRSLDILSHMEQDELDALLDIDTTTPEDVLAFLQKKIPTFHFLLKEEIENLKENLGR